MNKFVFTFKMVLTAIVLAFALSTANAAGKHHYKLYQAAQNSNGSVLSAYDLRIILRSVLKRNDVFQGYVFISSRRGNMFRIRIFNQQSGRVRYVFIDAASKRIVR